MKPTIYYTKRVVQKFIISIQPFLINATLIIFRHKEWTSYPEDRKTELRDGNCIFNEGLY
jgi:hypothetical protein